MITAPSSTKIKAGAGCSQNENSFEAGVEIANKAMNENSLSDETLFLLFATPHHKIDLVMNGIRSVMGENPKFLGCTTTGLVTNHFLSSSGALAGGAFISSETPFFEIFYEGPIKDNEFEAGENLAKQIRDSHATTDTPILLFYDSVKVTSVEGDIALSVATTILNGFYSYYKHWPTIAGMGAMGDIK